MEVLALHTKKEWRLTKKLRVTTVIFVIRLPCLAKEKKSLFCGVNKK
jgi:hypothetical protein